MLRFSRMYQDLLFLSIIVLPFLSFMLLLLIVIRLFRKELINLINNQQGLLRHPMGSPKFLRSIYKFVRALSMFVACRPCLPKASWLSREGGWETQGKVGSKDRGPSPVHSSIAMLTLTYSCGSITSSTSSGSREPSFSSSSTSSGSSTAAATVAVALASSIS